MQTKEKMERSVCSQKTVRVYGCCPPRILGRFYRVGGVVTRRLHLAVSMGGLPGLDGSWRVGEELQCPSGGLLPYSDPAHQELWVILKFWLCSPVVVAMAALRLSAGLLQRWQELEGLHPTSQHHHTTTVPSFTKSNTLNVFLKCFVVSIWEDFRTFQSWNMK